MQPILNTFPQKIRNFRINFRIKSKKYYPQRAKKSKIWLGVAGLSASPPPALPVLFLFFERGGKISKKIQKRRLDLFKRAEQGWPAASPPLPALFRISEGGGKPQKNF